MNRDERQAGKQSVVHASDPAPDAAPQAFALPKPPAQEEKAACEQDAGDEKRLALYASLLYDQALLVEGLPVEDPITFASEICSLM